MTNQTKTSVVLEYISPDDLDFDPANPRLAEVFTNKTQLEIQKVLFDAPYYASELVDSLIENGFIAYEPLVVKRRSKRYLVIEGNRRLAAIREIRKDLAQYPDRKTDLASIPVLVFPETTDAEHQKEARVYLGVHHMIGFREWPPISKARFLEQESQREGGLAAVLKETRLTKAKARRFLVPYRLLIDAKVNFPSGEDFWVLGEALQRAGIKKFVQLEVNSETLAIEGYNKKNLASLLDRLYGPKIRNGERDTAGKTINDTRDLAMLAAVLDSEKAFVALQAGKSLEESAIHVDTREQSIVRLSRVTKELSVLLSKLLHGKNETDKDLLESFKQFNASVKAYTKKAE